jgi:hypothetical protein
MAEVRFTCRPTDALIFINDRFLGSVAGLRGRPLIVPAGREYRLELRRDGYFSYFAEIKPRPGAAPPMDVELRPEPF